MNNNQEVRYHALDLGVRLMGERANLEEVIKAADRFHQYINIDAKPSEPLITDRAQLIESIKGYQPVPKPDPLPTLSDLLSTPDGLKELVSCSENPINFIPHFKHQHVVKGMVSFEPYLYQVGLIQNYHLNRFVIVNHARQMGISLTTAFYVLWTALFNSDQTILVLSNKFVQSLEFMDRIRYAFENLPPHLRAGVKEYNKGTITFDNGSKIIARAASCDAGRGLYVSMVVIDAASYLPHRRGFDFMDSIYPIISSSKNTRMIINSTPHDTDGIFYKIYSNPENADKWAKVELPWHLHPERDAAWEQYMRNNLGASDFAREYECKFVTVTPPKRDY